MTILQFEKDQLHSFYPISSMFCNDDTWLKVTISHNAQILQHTG